MPEAGPSGGEVRELASQNDVIGEDDAVVGPADGTSQRPFVEVELGAERADDRRSPSAGTGPRGCSAGQLPEEAGCRGARVGICVVGG